MQLLLAGAGGCSAIDVVNILDFAVLVREFGARGETLLRADFNEDGDLNVLDYSLLIAGNFGAFGPLAGTGLSGPEPTDVIAPPAPPTQDLLIQAPTP